MAESQEFTRQQLLAMHKAQLTELAESLHIKTELKRMEMQQMQMQQRQQNREIQERQMQQEREMRQKDREMQLEMAKMEHDLKARELNRPIPQPRADAQPTFKVEVAAKLLPKLVRRRSRVRSVSDYISENR